MEYKVGHYYKREYGHNCSVVILFTVLKILDTSHIEVKILNHSSPYMTSTRVTEINKTFFDAKTTEISKSEMLAVIL